MWASIDHCSFNIFLGRDAFYSWNTTDDHQSSSAFPWSFPSIACHDYLFFCSLARSPLALSIGCSAFCSLVTQALHHQDFSLQISRMLTEKPSFQYVPAARMLPPGFKSKNRNTKFWQVMSNKLGEIGTHCIRQCHLFKAWSFLVEHCLSTWSMKPSNQ